MPIMKICKCCGNELGYLLEAETNGKTGMVLEAGGVLIIDASAMRCKRCGTPVYHHSSLFTLVKTIKLTGRDCNEEDLEAERRG